MPSRDIYRAALCVDGNTARARNVARTQKDISDHIINSLSYKEVVINDDITQNLEIVAADTDIKKRFTTMPNETVNLGDVVLWNNMHWLVTSVDFDDEIVRRGLIEQCNRKIKWQNIHTLEIIERWCIATKPYASNVDSNNIVSTSNREYKIKLPYDDETKIVDLGRRFMLEIIDGNPRTYKMISTDSLTNRFEDMNDNIGFIVWNLEQDQSGETDDNTELMICNYVDPVTPPTPPSPSQSMTCKITGNSNIKCGYSRTYTPMFYDVGGSVIEGIVAYWTLDKPVGHESYYTVSYTDNKIKISVSDNECIIGDMLTLHLTNSDRNIVESTFEITVVV